MDNIKIDLLTEEEIEDGPKQLEVIKKYGKLAQGTDLFYLTGSTGNQDNNNCWYATKTLNEGFSEGGLYDAFQSINATGSIVDTNFHNRSGIRPVLELPEELYNLITSKQVIDEKGIARVEFGEYPQWLSKEYSKDTLVNLYQKEALKDTGNHYTFDNSDHSIATYYKDPRSVPFRPIAFWELGNGDKNFISIMANPIPNEIKLSDGNTYYAHNLVWLEVTPIIWLVDEENHRLISERCLLSGIRYNNPREKISSFECSEMYKYLNEYLLPEILQGEKRKKVRIEPITISNKQIFSLESKINNDSTLSGDELDELLNAMNQMKNEKTRK